ncbi:MAG: FAD-dependent oxidoreductase [Bacteroidetes bacterium]|nr:FAD-dependent oxidoreductase [Bacteroidota bacterium]
MQSEFVILGAGITGITVAAELKDRAVLLEKENSIGGLVRTHCIDGFWFDHVLHILHFRDDETEAYIKNILPEGMLQPCPPKAWIETEYGNVLYPFQLNIGALDDKMKMQCVHDFAKACFSSEKEQTDNYKDFLLNIFGKGMCEVFYFPYNKKLYKYPLEKINATQLSWNLHQPKFEDILEGAFFPNKYRETYNTHAFYPRPHKDATQRGMQVLTEALAKNVVNKKLNFTVTAINTANKTITGKSDGGEKQIKYDRCFSTIPLPVLMKMCSNVPPDLIEKVQSLENNIVYSVAVCIKGKRPENTGHWRYYTDENLPFTRLIFMTEFDEYNAPENGWGVLAEVSHYARNPALCIPDLEKKIIFGFKKLGLLDQNQVVHKVHTWIAEPAYVIFTHETKNIIEECHEYLKLYDITSSGRFGNWEYSSIYQNIRTALQWTKQFK